jgi:hypothetical protein
MANFIYILYIVNPFIYKHPTEKTYLYSALRLIWKTYFLQNGLYSYDWVSQTGTKDGFN